MADRGRKRKMVSMTLMFDKTTSELLDELKEAFGASSKTEVIRKAIALLDIAKEAKQSGNTVYIKDEKTNSNTRLVL